VYGMSGMAQNPLVRFLVDLFAGGRSGVCLVTCDSKLNFIRMEFEPIQLCELTMIADTWRGAV